MTVAEFIAEARARVIDQEKIDALRRRMQEAEDAYEAQLRNSAADKEILSRTYSL